MAKTKLEFTSYPRPVQMLVDSFIMVKRSSTHILRNTDQMFGTFFQPIMFLLLFVAVFGGAVAQALPAGVDYTDFLMAGIIIQTVAFSATTTAVAITNDLKRGIVDRFRSLPMSNLAVLNGRATAIDLGTNSPITICTTVAIKSAMTTEIVSVDESPMIIVRGLRRKYATLGSAR